MMTKEEIFLYDELIEMGIATAKEIDLVRCCMDGLWMDVLEAILHARTGYRTIEQLFDEEEEEEEE